MTDKVVLRGAVQELMVKFGFFSRAMGGLNVEDMTAADWEGAAAFMMDFQRDLAALEAGLG